MPLKLGSLEILVFAGVWKRDRLYVYVCIMFRREVDKVQRMIQVKRAVRVIGSCFFLLVPSTAKTRRKSLLTVIVFHRDKMSFFSTSSVYIYILLTLKKKKKTSFSCFLNKKMVHFTSVERELDIGYQAGAFANEFVVGWQRAQDAGRFWVRSARSFEGLTGDLCV